MNYEESKKEWVRGYACAIANLILMEGKVTPQVHELFRSGISQIPLSELMKYCDPQDFEVLENNYGAFNS